MKPKTLLPLLLVALLVGCEAVGSGGATGPAGPAGPQGPAGERRLVVRTVVSDFSIDSRTDVLVVERGAVAVNLPALAAAGPGRVISVRCMRGCTNVSIATANRREVIDELNGQAFALGPNEAMTLVSENGDRWVRISRSRF
jgi:hypothetical protein